MRTATIVSNTLLGSLLVAGCWHADAAAAQTVYRCGAQSNEYSHQPCAAGKAVEVADVRSAEQVAQAMKTRSEQQKLALQMARERRQQQSAVKPAKAAGINFLQSPAGPAAVASRKAPKGSSRPRPAKPSALAKQNEFVAIEPGSGKKKSAKKSVPAA